MNQEQVKSEEQTQNQVQGWKDVTLDANAPLNILVSFLNVLNQRLCALEDNVFIKTDDGKMLSLTEIYAMQAQAEAAAAQAKKEENK